MPTIIENCSGCLGASIHHTCGKQPDAKSLAKMSCSASGELIVWEEDGGYCSPYLALETEEGKVSFEELLLKLFPEMDMFGGKKRHRIKVSIDVLEQNAEVTHRAARG